MTHFSIYRPTLRGLLSSSATALALVWSSTAVAQDSGAVPAAPGTPPSEQAEPKVENADGTRAGDSEIIITGSRIARAGFDTLQPAIVVGDEQLEQRAATNVADVLNEMPAFGYPGASPVSLQTQSTGGGATVSAGQNFVNLFGLGSQRTLTLVNGKRFVSSNTPALEGPTSPGVQVDINAIPTALVDRIETIAVGGAPIYGSDAIAGTVNIILKRDFEGLEINGLGGVSDEGDAERYRVQAIYGLNFAGGRGNVVFNAEYNRQNPLLQSERKSTALQEAFITPHASANSPFAQVYITDARIGNLNLNGLPLYSRTGATAGPSALRNAAGQRIRFDESGNIVPYDIGSPTGVPTTFVGGEGLNLAGMQSLITKTERYIGNIFFNFAVSDSTNFHAEGWYARTDALEPVNQPIHAAVGFRTPDETDRFIRNGVIPVRLDNPFLSAQAVEILRRAIDRNGDGNPDNVLNLDGLPGGDTPGFYLARPLFDLLDNYPTKTGQELYRGLFGVDGSVQLGGRDFRWDVAYTYGEAIGKAENNAIILANYNQALDAVRAGGNIVCRNPSNGCAPLNLFGFGAPSEEAKDFVTDPARARSRNTQHDLTANLSGSLAQLPGGELGVAAGIEYRRETAAFTANDLATSGRALALLFNPVAGKFDTKEIYAEAVVPIVGRGMNVPMVHELELEGAARYVHHSVAGGDLTWTAGGRYSPVRGMTLRGNFTRSIRSPAIGELFLPTVNSRSTAADPCDSRFIGQATPLRAQNCAAAGIVQPFNSNISNALQPITLEGNEDLKNEAANSWTVGAVLKPNLIPGLSLAVDWVDIYIKDAIFNLSPTLVLQGCYDSASFPSNEFCGLFTRSAAGQITSMRTKYYNFGFLDFAGLTAELAYRVPLGRMGDLDLSANYFYLHKSNFSISGSDLTEVAGTVGASKHSGNAFVNWRKGPFNWFWNAIYISGAAFSKADTEFTRDVKGVDDWWMFHTGVAYELNDRLRFQLNVDNVFDIKPPKYSIQAHGGGGIPGISTYYSGVLGRYFTASARLKF